jgi:hypothetical protein
MIPLMEEVLKSLSQCNQQFHFRKVAETYKNRKTINLEKAVEAFLPCYVPVFLRAIKNNKINLNRFLHQAQSKRNRIGQVYMQLKSWTEILSQMAANRMGLNPNKPDAILCSELICDYY